MSSSHGSFVWHDLMTTDTDGAVRFYDELAGWKTQPWQGPNPYTLWMNGEKALGGVMPLSEELRKNGVPPHWIPSVGVNDVDATTAKSTQLGGKTIAPPMDIQGAGRYAIIQDPQGVTIAIFAGEGDMQASPDAGIGKGDFSWHELTTTDHVAAFKFYSELFGWEKNSEFDMGPMGVYLIYGQAGKQYGGMMTKTPDMPVPPNWLCYIRVADAKAAAESVTRLGGKVMNGPMEVPGGDWIAMCTDPQGAAIAFHALKAS